MREKESSGGRRLRSRRRRRGKRKHHHSGRRDHRHHRNHRSNYRSKSNSDDEEDEESDCSCSSCCSSSSCTDSSCSTCSSSSSSDDDAGDSFDLQWKLQSKNAISAGSNQNQHRIGNAATDEAIADAARSAGARQVRTGPPHPFLTSAGSSISTGSLTRPPPLRPDIKRQPNTACLIQ